MTAYTNDKGTRWRVKSFKNSGMILWDIQYLHSRDTMWMWLSDELISEHAYLTEADAQVALNALAKKKGWRKVEEP